MCERHVGRKSTNNLNLTCKWGSCTTTVVKRDHITSHIRVHVPLKPHKCDFCGKAFKRPQDLKKHVKTHADDSVLVRSPEPSTRNPDMMFPGHAKGYATGAHYFEPLNSVPSQGYVPAPTQYYQPHAPQPPNPSYGNVYYTLNQGPDPGQGSYESKKRGYDALNEFFGDLKRRQFDPNSYTAVGQRLLGLQNLQLPILSGGPVPEYQPMPAPVAVAAGGGGGGAGGMGGGGGGYSGGSHPFQYQLPPMGNVRTKNDLVNIDQFLEQMQNTIYENDDNVAAAGIAQPGAHYVQGGMNYRTTNSPPSQLPPTHATTTAGTTSAGTAAPMLNTNSGAVTNSPPTGTPALTPPSSAQSYTSGRSPISLPANHHHHHQHHDSANNSSSMYPRLPSATLPDSVTAGYPTASSAAPPSTLSGVFDHDDRRRYTGGTLQRARPNDARRMSMSVDGSPTPSDDDGDRTPPAKPSTTETTTTGQDISASLIDPALHSTTNDADDADDDDSDDAASTLRTAQAATEVAERADSQWVSLVRALEGLRGWINYRIDHDDFESEDASRSNEHPAQSEQQPEQQQAPSHEDVHMDGLETGSTTDAEHKALPSLDNKPETSGESDDAVLYPSLRALDDDGDSKM